MAPPAAGTTMSAALAIFVKTPGHSPVKTRLAASIGQQRAEHFHRLAAAAVAAVARAATPAVQPCWAVAERDALDDLIWNALPTLWQGEGTLGARLHHVCASLQQRHGRVLLIGADAPQIRVDLLSAALEALDDPATPFVLAPAHDGGFWLFGTRQPVPEAAWMALRYSCVDTASMLIEALSSDGAIAPLPLLNDVDDGDDLASLIFDLKALPAPLPEQRELLDWLLEECMDAPRGPERLLPPLGGGSCPKG
jgi:rSAM/selenodomain-associated transferase 1